MADTSFGATGGEASGSDLRVTRRAQRARYAARALRGQRGAYDGGSAAAVLRARQLAGQMALDMRPRSTCRRLTKAIPVPDMTEACHGDLGRSPPSSIMSDTLVPNRETRVASVTRRGSCRASDRRQVRPSRARPGARGGHLRLLLDLGVEELEAAPQVVVHRVLAVLAARVQPDPLGRRPAPASARPGPRPGRRRTTAGGRRCAGPGRRGAARSTTISTTPVVLRLQLHVPGGRAPVVRDPGLHARPVQVLLPLRVRPAPAGRSSGCRRRRTRTGSG